jgi:hypothetical protein
MIGQITASHPTARRKVSRGSPASGSTCVRRIDLRRRKSRREKTRSWCEEWGTQRDMFVLKDILTDICHVVSLVSSLSTTVSGLHECTKWRYQNWVDKRQGRHFRHRRFQGRKQQTLEGKLSESSHVIISASLSAASISRQTSQHPLCGHLIYLNRLCLELLVRR